jgi:hypothetical protein
VNNSPRVYHLCLYWAGGNLDALKREPLAREKALPKTDVVDSLT